MWIFDSYIVGFKWIRVGFFKFYIFKLYYKINIKYYFIDFLDF